MSTYDFRDACDTYRLLREKGYPEKATLKLVGDRHRLSRIQRNCLFRGVIPGGTAALRRARLVDARSAAGQLLAVDWYNVLITVESYLKGDTLFLSDDGVVRDASATHGSYRTGPVTPRAMEAILAMIAGLAPSRVELYLDLPIAFSARMAEELRRRLGEVSAGEAAREIRKGDQQIEAQVTLAPSADFPLKASTGIVASSDSAVLDSSARAMDLAHVVLAQRFGFSPPAVHDLFPGSPGSPPQ